MDNQIDSLYWKVLVVRCQVGDRAAFEELVTDCQPRLRHFLFKLVAGQENVADLSQEVWLNVFRDLPKLIDPGAFLPWFYRVARNRAYRRMRRRSTPVGSLENIDVADDTETSTDFTAEDAAAVHAALDQLSPEHREVLLLKFIENMSYKDIAAVADCQIGTVRSRLYHAKQLLRQILESGKPS
jgi:RNA polymerase sigma-70 factor (ECF subfamily)